MAQVYDGIVKLYTPMEQGVSQKTNEPWYKQQMVIETYGNYPKMVAIEFFGDKISELQKYPIGVPVKVSAEAESREYNQRWYTTIRAWKIESGSATANHVAGNVQAQPAAQQQQPQYKVGDVVNGHQLGADMQWHPVQAAAPQQQQYQIGQVVNGHQWNGSAWLPVQQAAPAPAPAAAPAAAQQYNNPNPTYTAPAAAAPPAAVAPTPNAPIAQNPAQQAFFNTNPDDIPF